ncbi:MAG: hypothetical protein RLZZ09_809 [Pseudomonadota bacterium]|jgi:hypothetical protein
MRNGDLTDFACGLVGLLVLILAIAQWSLT